MRLPQHLLDSRFFSFDTVDSLAEALGSSLSTEDEQELQRLNSLGLIPAVSPVVLSTMLGINSGIIWSMLNRPSRYYNVFEIKTGSKTRTIQAPRVALKIIQKWFGTHLIKKYNPSEHVFGFIPGRSHIAAASVHQGAVWIYKFDIKDFFPSVTHLQVNNILQTVGYSNVSASFLTKLMCYHGSLTQGSPTSPTLSNLAFEQIDNALAAFAAANNLRLSRYADDIVFSSTSNDVPEIEAFMQGLLEKSAWQLSSAKTKFLRSPKRLKVHGLLVDGKKLRLTKGYRNKIRAYSHIISNREVSLEDSKRLKGHLNYANAVLSFKSDIENDLQPIVNSETLKESL